MEEQMAEQKIIWKERKRTIFGLPLSFTTYTLTEEKLLIKSGLFNIKEEEIRLYRILDMTLQRTFGERIFGLGSIHVDSADKSTPEFFIARIKRSAEIKELLSDKVEQQREKKRVSSREYMSDNFSDDDM